MRRFFLLVGISNQCTDDIKQKVDPTAMASLFDLRDVLQADLNGFNDCSLRQYQLVEGIHQLVVHLFSDLLQILVLVLGQNGFFFFGGQT